MNAPAVVADDVGKLPDSSPGRRRSHLAVLAVVALLAASWMFGAEIVRVQSSSMSPTINDGAHLAVDKFSLRFRSPHRGEIVVARRPDSGELVVKRVVAVGGDSVGIDDGRLLLNGSLVDEPYADLGGMPGRFWGPDIVPSGEVFLLGDQRAESEDSRVFGSVELDAIVGRVIGA